VSKLTLIDFPEEPSKHEKCDIHGEYESRQIIGAIFSKCPECGRIEHEKSVREKAQRARDESAIRWQSKLGEACIPERFKSRRLDNFTADGKGQQDALDICMKFAEDFPANAGKSLLFLGLPGTGKTHLSVGICQMIMELHGSTALFTSAMKMLQRIKGTWNPRSEESELNAIKVFVRPDLLVLDEIGVQFGSETEKNILFHVINERYERNKPVILISNLTLKEIVPYLGERVYDRLREDGAESVVFAWESFRSKAA